MERMTPREAGVAKAKALVTTWPPLTDEQVEKAARILAIVAREEAEGLADRSAGQ